MSSVWIDWACIIAGIAIGAAGLALAIVALFRDRARGRRSCPKCWYDMTGVPELTCPECGRTAKREKGLMRTRRRWWRALAGMLIVLLGGGTALAPKVRRDGWASLVPTPVLVYGVPRGAAAWVQPALSSKPELQWAAQELKARIDAKGLAAWEWRLLLRRERVIRARRDWPAGKPLLVEVQAPAWMGDVVIVVTPRVEGGRQVSSQKGDVAAGTAHPLRRRSDPFDLAADASASLGEAKSEERGSLPAGTTQVDFDFVVHQASPLNVLTTSWGPPGNAQLSFNPNASPMFAGSIRLPIRVADAGVEVPPRRDDAAVTARVREALKVRFLCRGAGKGQVRPVALNLLLDRSKLGVDRGMTLSLKAEVLRDNQVEATGWVPLYMEEYAPARGSSVQERDDKVIQVRLPATIDETEISRWSIRLTGIPHHVLEDWGSSGYWGGTLLFRAVTPSPEGTIRFEAEE